MPTQLELQVRVVLELLVTLPSCFIRSVKTLLFCTGRLSLPI